MVGPYTDPDRLAEGKLEMPFRVLVLSHVRPQISEIKYFAPDCGEIALVAARVRKVDENIRREVQTDASQLAAR